MNYSIDHSKKNKHLPSISKDWKHPEKSQFNIPTFVETYLQENSNKKTLKCHPDKLENIKAKNFINKSQIIDSPQVISAISQCVRQQFNKSKACSTTLHQSENVFNDSSFFQKKHQNSRIDKQNIGLTLPQDHKFRTQQKIFEKVSQSVHCKKTNISFDRYELLNLAKWIDNKLEQFNKAKSITIPDIIDYKQNILNYGLGKIIDSVSKKCKQEGKLLQILWNNTFKIFQNVLTIVSKSAIGKQQQFIQEFSQLKEIYQNSLKFQKDQSSQIKTDMDILYQKMKRVIIWNKRLRKQKKNLTIMNRILQYRNQTYSQALQETIQMFLKSVPQTNTINFAKKIIQKLARQKRRKKKTFDQKQIESDIKKNAKDLVISWLRRNGFVQEQIQEDFHLSKLSNDQKVFLNNVDDQNKIDAVNIYDFFKLLDIGVQATPQVQCRSCQYGDDLHPKEDRGMITEHVYSKNAQIQINFKQGVNFQIKQNQKGKVVRSNFKKKSNASKLSEKSQNISIRQSLNPKKKQKGITDHKGNFTNKNNVKKSSKKQQYLKKQDQQIKYMKRQKTVQSQQENNRDKFFSKDFAIISQKKSEEFNFDSEGQIKNSLENQNGQKYSLSKYQAEGSNEHGRQLSIQDFADLGSVYEQQKNLNKKANLKDHWKKYRQSIRNDLNKKDSRRSMNFIKIDSNVKSLKKLQKEKFNQVYEQSREQNSKNRQQMYETLIRRRSFYKKNKIIYQNSTGVEQSKQRTNALYKNEPNYRLNIKSQAKQEDNENSQEYKIDKINQKLAITSNLAKSKTMLTAKAAFKQISQSAGNTKKQPPRNKQFFNSSIASINKYVGGLVQDYIKQIKRQKDGIQSQCQKTYYPLNMILMERMNFKYGLKDISQKKLKDFIQKILTFAPASEKISLYSLLLGMEGQTAGADELLIYLRSIVYFQKKPNVQNSSMYLFKDPNLIQKITTDSELISENLGKVIQEFFDKKGFKEVEKEVLQYLQNSPNASTVSIQKIAQIIIRSLIKRKKLYHTKCENLYKILIKRDNIFTNIFKALKIYSAYSAYVFQNKNTQQSSITTQQSRSAQNISKILKQFLKRSDIIDQIYGKSISFDRFEAACMVTDFPNIEDLQTVIEFINSNFINILQKSPQRKNLLVLPKQFMNFSNENNEFLSKISQKWKIKVQQSAEDNQVWSWKMSQIVAQKVETQVNRLMGKLNLIGDCVQNFFLSSQK